MIHDTALSLMVANESQLPEKNLLVTLGTISWQLSPETVYGPVLVELEEDDHILLQIMNSTSPLVLHWSEDRQFVSSVSNGWNEEQGSMSGNFSYPAEDGLYSIRYQCGPEAHGVIRVQFSAEITGK